MTVQEHEQPRRRKAILSLSEHGNTRSEQIESGNAVDSAEPAPEVIYEWLESTDLTATQIVETLLSYKKGFEKYSKIQLTEKAIRIMYEDVFVKYKDVILNLPEDATIFLPGIGGVRDAMFLVLLRPDLHVIASDVVVEMLREGQQNLIWQNLELIAKVIVELDPDHTDTESGESHWMIADVIAIGARLSKIITPKIKQQDSGRFLMKNEVLASITDRIHFSQDNILNLPYASNSSDMSMYIAVFPHLSKDQVLPAILEALRVLKPGQIFHFSLRADVEKWQTAESGRTFRDTVLGEELSRYFATCTEAEINRLILELKKIFPPIDIVVDRDFTPHPDSNKPPFIHIRITKSPIDQEPVLAT